MDIIRNTFWDIEYIISIMSRTVNKQCLFLCRAIITTGKIVKILYGIERSKIYDVDIFKF